MKSDTDYPITLGMSADECSLLLNLLSERPYKEVAGTIKRFSQQAQACLEVSQTITPDAEDAA